MTILDEVLPSLERRWVSRHVARQLMRAATSGAANYAEARGAESRADFVHKIGIAAKELREALQRLRLLARSRTLAANLANSPLLERLVAESDELIAILTASAQTAKSTL